MRGAQPLGLERVPDFNFSFSILNHLFRYARLLYAFGDQRRPAEMIPDPPEPRHMGRAYFQRSVCTIAKICALSWRGRTLDRATIRQETFQSGGAGLREESRAEPDSRLPVDSRFQPFSH